MPPANRGELLAHIAAHPITGTWADKRAAFAARLLPSGHGTPTTLAGRPGLYFGDGPPNCLFLHGGGYALGSPATHARLASRLAGSLGTGVFSASYPLAPEQSWPAQLDAILALVDAHPFTTLAGGSAGGHLALNVALRRPGMFRALALFSPNTDRTGRSDTRVANTPSDPMNSDKGDRDFYRLSMPDTPPEDVEASPLLADLSGLPPTFVSVSEGEVLLGDGLLLARALEGAQVAHESFQAPYAEAGTHMFESWPHILPAGDEAIRRAARFLGNLA